MFIEPFVILCKSLIAFFWQWLWIRGYHQTCPVCGGRYLCAVYGADCVSKALEAPKDCVVA